MWQPVLILTALLSGASPPQDARTSRAPAVAPAAPAPGTAGLQSFDSSQAELRWTNRHWQLVAGGVVLKDFGRRESEARAALRLVRELRLSQRGTIGSPHPVMEYWLADGHAPQGLVAGLHPVPLDPASLRAEEIQGQWWVRDDQRALFNFGGAAEDAREAVAVLRRYDFTQFVPVGLPAPDMQVFLGSGSALAPRRILAPRLAPASPALARTFPPGHATGPATPEAAVRRTSFEQPASSKPPHAPASLGDQLAEAERVPVSWRQAEIRQDDDGWKLVAGNITLANFGPHESDARTALAAMRYYHFTEHGSLGRPRPLFSYFLVNGQAPRGYMMGLRHVPFQPEVLTVRQTDDAWGLYEGNRAILQFGDHPDEARQALRLIQRYQFDTLCLVGRPDTGAMTFFVRAH
jgi:hypothetical protein